MKRLFTSFIFLITAITSLGSIAQSSPQNLSVSVSGSSVSFSWIPSPASGVCWGDPCTFHRYMLQRSGVGNFIFVSSNRATTSFTLTGLPDGQHTFTLRAYYSVDGNPDDFANFGATASVNIGGALPPAPGQTYVLVNNTALDIFWSPSVGATTYQLQRNSTDLVSVSAASATNYKDTSVLPGVSYTYRIRACNAAGCSDWINYPSISIPTIPVAPANITVIPRMSSIAVSWSISAGATRYELQRNSTAIASIAAPGHSATRYTDHGATGNTNYIYRTRACNTTGCSLWRTSSGTTLLQMTTYAYDALGRLVGVKQNGAVKQGYRYDKAGNRCSVSTTEINIDEYCQ